MPKLTTNPMNSNLVVVERNYQKSKLLGIHLEGRLNLILCQHINKRKPAENTISVQEFPIT